MCGPLGIFALLFGCSSPHEHEKHGAEHASGAVCPAGSTLTYATFGKTFMQSYCTSCHSSTLSGAARNGGPTEHNVDTLDGVRLSMEHIDFHAAAGPLATNTEMPLSDPKPSLAERQQLGEWIACNAP